MWPEGSGRWPHCQRSGEAVPQRPVLHLVRERETGGVVSQEPLLSAEFSPRSCNRGDTQAHTQRTFSTLLANFKLELRTMV